MACACGDHGRETGAEGSPSRWGVALNAIYKVADHIRAGDVIFAGGHPKEMTRAEAEEAIQLLDTILNNSCGRRVAAETRRHLARLRAEDAAHVRFKLISRVLLLMQGSIESAQKRARAIKIMNNQVPHDDALALANDLRCTQQLCQHINSIAPDHDDIRRWIILGDLGLTVLLGATLDELLLPTKGTLQAANQFEYREWLCRFRALEMTVDSAIVRAMYDTVFGYVGGDPEREGDIEAGSAVRAQLDMLSCRGSFFWKMRAGTGDIVAAPLYERLKERGVDFQFFRQVEKLVPSGDGRSVAEIHIIRQAEVLRSPYRPLLKCKGIPVWPDRPDLSQLENGEFYKGVDFESYWAPKSSSRLVLKAGENFDALVLGIGLGALPMICEGLCKINNNWAAMLTNGKTVGTQALQLWMDQATAASGWPGPPSPVVTSFDASPMDTWLDGSHAIDFEDWGSKRPAQMAMICGPLPGHQDIPNQHETGYPEEVEEQIAKNGDEFLDAACDLWPKFCYRGTLDPERILGKVFQPGINPSDRYVQTPRDSSRFRLAPGGSGFNNMVLAGDWTDYGLNLGCFEGAVVSGRLAANALGGQPRKILREEPHGPGGGTVSAGRLYAEHHPPQTLGGTIVFPGVRMWAFFLRGQIDTLTNLCSRFFDVPTGGRVTFAPLSQIVTMTVSELPHAYFYDRPDRGRSTEREVAFGIAGEYTCRGADGNPTATGIATFMPYLFVDNPVALMTGREVLGYFKLLGEVGLPGRRGAREDFFLNVFGAATMAAGIEWGEQRLLTIGGRDASVRHSPPPIPQGALREADDRPTSTSKVQALVQSVLSSSLPGRALLGLGNIRGLLSGSMSQIFLKQFRAEGSGNLAAYQAVTMADYQVTDVHYVRPTQSVDITIHPLESMPIARELGLSSKMVETGLEVGFDMTLGTGRVLWPT
jgi:hypothetical protein